VLSNVGVLLFNKLQSIPSKVDPSAGSLALRHPISQHLHTILVLFPSIVLYPLACPLAISYKGTLLKKEALLLVLRSPFLGLERLVVVGTWAGKSIYC
jgi:hypothetical protein